MAVNQDRPDKTPYRNSKDAFVHGARARGLLSAVRNDGGCGQYLATSQRGVSVGGSTTVCHGPLFIDHRGTDGAADTMKPEAGGGYYRLRPDGPTRGIAPSRCWAAIW